MRNLDDINIIKEIDKSNMLDILLRFPLACKEAVEIGDNFSPDVCKTDFKNVVFCGLGGSAIGADLIRSYLADTAKVPVFVNRNYTLPGVVDSQTLVFCCSYSGNTEETLSAYSEAKEKDARIIVVTSGGKIEEEARGDGVPCLIIPGGLPPRTALSYSFFAPLLVMSKLEVVDNPRQDAEKAIEELIRLRDTLSPGVEISQNRAKEIAELLYDKFPVIYAAADFIDVVALRWRGQLAENSKTLASHHLFPELNHNEIVGWEFPERLLKDSVVIILRDEEDHSRIKKRMDITKQVISEKADRVIEVDSTGKGRLARVFSLIYTGDMVSFYLAVLNGVDPTPVEKIDYLKKELAKE